MGPPATPAPDAVPRRSRAARWYTAAAAAAVGLAPKEADAQIVYTDLDPGEFVQDGSFFVDFDGDGDAELELNEDDVDNNGNPRDFTRAYRESSVAPDSITGIVAQLIPFSGGGTYAYPVPLAAGTVINGSSDFQDYYTFSFTFTGDDPVDWLGTGEHYLGVRMNLDNGGTVTQHYGWVLIEVPVQGGSMIVKSFAYEATPNTPITTGATGTAIAPGPDGAPGTHALSTGHPNPFGTESRFTLEVARTEDVRVAVYDVTGREVAVLHEGALAQGHPYVFTLDGRNLPEGVYVVRAVSPSFTDSLPLTLSR